ncbi:hypothetical protein CTAYLR_003662 [Chrysophaeum taylorii]|uniref:J domain-containing protein n=1 Tax=Chrysophaeum taylorii TaxID=2483200 RepID=A0AAD7UEM5_9STRA|nr:hypothetical protein CTAYLR_003662 [Chrysophaeum taylorii]
MKSFHRLLWCAVCVVGLTSKREQSSVRRGHERVVGPFEGNFCPCRRRRGCTKTQYVLSVARGGGSDDGGYYAQLGVRPGASNDEIKRAYRKKSLSCHPDKGGDEEAFKKLSEAYSVLSDPSKRRAYDRIGVSGIDPTRGGQPQPGSGGMDARTAQQMFEQMFGSFGGAFGEAFGGAGGPWGAFGGGGGAGRRAAPRRFVITVSLDDCYQGRTISVSLGDETCHVRIEPGMGEGDVIRATLAGAPVFFELREAPHAVFKRSNADLLVDASIPLADALGGAPRVTIKRLDGSTLRVNVAPLGAVLRHGALRSLDGEGMPIRGHPQRRGKLFVRVFVVFPKTLNLEPRDRATLRSLLGATRKTDDYDSRLRTLRDAQPHEWGRSGATRRQASSEEEDDDGPAGFRFAFR